MSTSENKTIARRYFEDFWNTGNTAVIAELVAADAVGHVPGVTVQGRDALQQRLSALYTMYSEPHFTVEDQIAEGDKVAVRWTFRGRHSGTFMGVAPSGQEVMVTGMNLFRLASGRIAEIWLNGDDLGELQQLGVLPATEPTGA
jgi:steroid delta-isomerase-like uncharacterized protein